MLIKYLIRLDRVAAWILFIGMFIYFITGYGMTKGFIDPVFATKLHTGFLNYVIAIAFIVHASFAIHLALKRWKMWNVLSKSLLIIFFILFGCFFVYLENYEKKNETVVSESSRVQTSSNSESTSTKKTFTLSELSKYDGQDGNPAYVAVDGNVYDLSSVFRNGSHFSHYAGKELTSDFYSYHVKSQISKYPIVGELE